MGKLGLLAAAGFMGIMPFLYGMILWNKKKVEDVSVGMLYGAGLCLELGLFECMALPAIFMARDQFSRLVFLYAGVMGILGVICVILFGGKLVQILGIWWKNLPLKEPLFWIVTALVLYQVFYVVYFQHMDLDDSYFIGTSTAAVQTDTMYVFDPYTGNVMPSLPSRYVLSPFPIWMAAIAKIAGLHPAMFAHTVLPIFLIPGAYLIYSAIARELWPEKKSTQQLFLFFLTLILLFSGYSMRQMGTMLLFRIWQGKAVLASMLLPFVFLLFSQSYRDKKLPSIPLLLSFSLACCMVSSMGIILGAIVLGLYAILYAFCWKDIRVIFTVFVCALPNLVGALVYLLIL